VRAAALGVNRRCWGRGCPSPTALAALSGQRDVLRLVLKAGGSVEEAVSVGLALGETSLVRWPSSVPRFAWCQGACLALSSMPLEYVAGFCAAHPMTVVAVRSYLWRKRHWWAGVRGMLLSGGATREVMEAALRAHVMWVEATPEVRAAFRRLGVRPAKAMREDSLCFRAES
jgi:hypothetical protein